MNIEEQFNLIAKEYDSNRRRFIPDFDGYYDATTRMIAANISAPERVLDLGAGTGLLSYFWYRQFQDTEYVLVDIAEEMLGVAKERFKGLSSVSYRAMDYTKELPEEEFNLIISALSIHHLEHSDKQALFKRIYEKLPSGALFINYDQFCAETPMINDMIGACWEDQMLHSGLSEKDIALWRERKKLDRECSVNEEIEMLKSAGFEIAESVYSNLKFAVIVAKKL